MDNSSASSIAVNTFVAPGEAFRALKERPQFLLPLLLLIVVISAVMFMYLNGIDMAAAVERAISQNPNVTDAQIDRIVKSVSSIGQAGIASIYTIVIVIFVLIALLLSALYYKIVSLITGDGVTYKLWFSTICFAALPLVLGNLATLANLIVSDISLMSTNQMNPLTLANLLGLEQGVGQLSQIAINVDPTAIWSFALGIVGYKTISGKGYFPSLAIVAAPILVIVGLIVIL